MQEALVKDAQHQIDGHQHTEDQERLGLDRPLKVLRGTTHAHLDLRRQHDAGQRAVDAAERLLDHHPVGQGETHVLGRELAPVAHTVVDLGELVACERG